MPSKTQKQPFMSIVVACLNGEQTLAAALDSLINQAYPKKRYEIIVVNDGSTDNTEIIAKSYPGVRYIGLKINQGIAAARNIGLEAVKGDIFVGFDDDCVAEPTWLAELAKGYEADNPIGVGGVFIEPQPVKGLANLYVSARDSNIGARLAGPEPASKNPLRRLWRYLCSHVQESQQGEHKTAVTALYGANGSFQVSALRKVSGWHPAMTNIEDRDLCQRLQNAYPERKLYIMPKAVILHGGGQTLRQYLLRPYKRGLVNLAFHLINNIPPPIFPFPLLFIAICGIMALYSPLLFLAAILCLPQILYFWWPLQAIRHHRAVFLLFPYIQLIEEIMVIAGLTRGVVRLLHPKTDSIRQKHPGFRSFMLTLGMIAGWMGVTLLTTESWLHTLISVPFLLFVPGYCAWLLVAPAQQRNSFGLRILGYSIGLSLLLLMVAGLVLNETFVLRNITQPLTLWPLTLAIGGITACLALGAFLRAPQEYRFINWHVPANAQLIPTSGAIAVGLLLPALAVMGAITLNNGGSSGLAMLSMGGIAGILLLLVFQRKVLSPYYGWFLYCVCLSILLGTSMRGWSITGHDVMQEFQVFQLTLSHAAWHMSYYQDAYTACLSITILPTIFQKLTGMGDPYIFKFLFQLFAALLAPLIYEMLHARFGKFRALLAVVLFITFPTFLTDIMMLNRQETALLFLVLSLMVGFDRHIGLRLKSLLSFLFLVGMILSHYSTSYIALGALLVTLIAAGIWRWAPVLFQHQSKLSYKQLTNLYHTPVICAAIVILIAWGSIATQTSNNIYQTITSVAAALKLQPSNTVSPHPVIAPNSVASYDQVALLTRKLPAADYYPAATVSHYPLASSLETTLPPNTQITHISTSLGASLNTIYTALRSAYALAIEGLIVAGISFALFFRRHTSELPLQYVFFGVGTLILVGAQVVLPSAAINYGTTRVIQESLVVLSLPMILVGIWLLRLVRIPEHLAETTTAVILIGFYLVFSGLLPALTGGFKPVLALNNSGFYYEAYYTHQEEITAAHWLNTNTPVGSRVYSDEFMRRKLITFANIFSQPTLVPTAIPIDSYVLLSYGNVVFNQVAAYAGSNLIYYQPPLKFLNANKDVVYSSTDIRIYK